MQSTSVSRRYEINLLRTLGLSYAQIGRRFHISAERVRQILKPKALSQAEPDTQQQNQEKLMTAAEIAAELGIKRTAVLYWAKTGKLPCVHMTRRTVRFRPEDVRRFCPPSK